MDSSFEKQLIEIIEPVYKKGRAGDWDHVLRVVKHGLKDWFRTQTSISLAQELSEEMGLFEGI